tara:strand:+ start:3085 stop:3927 length:843 start_codon:yes stop_codon:yes gene_type:complete
MSQLNVNTIKNRTGQGGISLPYGANSAGVITATNFDGSLKALDGDVTVGGALTVTGNMTVEGTQTIINTSSLEVADKTVGIGSTSSPTDASANGAGIVVYGSTDKSLTWGTSGTKWTLTGGALQAPELNITGVSTFNSSVTFKGADFDGTNILKEKCNVVAGKLSDNPNIDLENGMVHLYTTADTTICTPDIRMSSSVTLNSVMDIGDTIVVTLISTAGASAYSAQVTIDAGAVTENWIGGEAPGEGGSSGLDIYSYTITKTSNTPAWNVICNLSKTAAA